jgi:hypothetical protein
MDPKRMNHDARVASPRAPLAAVAVISATALVATTLLPILFATVTLTGLTAAPASASTASMAAQGIPLGLIPDVSSLARFPASALSLKPGLYGRHDDAGRCVPDRLGAGRNRLQPAHPGVRSFRELPYGGGIPGAASGVAAARRNPARSKSTG